MILPLSYFPPDGALLLSALKKNSSRIANASSCSWVPSSICLKSRLRESGTHVPRATTQLTSFQVQFSSGYISGTFGVEVPFYKLRALLN